MKNWGSGPKLDPGPTQPMVRASPPPLYPLSPRPQRNLLLSRRTFFCGFFVLHRIFSCISCCIILQLLSHFFLYRVAFVVSVLSSISHRIATFFVHFFFVASHRSVFLCIIFIASHRDVYCSVFFFALHRNVFTATLLYVFAALFPRLCASFCTASQRLSSPQVSLVSAFASASQYRYPASSMAEFILIGPQRAQSNQQSLPWPSVGRKSVA